MKKENKIYKKSNIAALILAVTIFGTSFLHSGCANTPSQNFNDSTLDPQNTINDVVIDNPQSIDDINPVLKISSMYGEDFITIDEKSLLQIIKLAMQDAENYFVGLEAPNMTINPDGTTSTNPGDFYPEWMNEYHFLARARTESGDYSVNVLGSPVGENGYRAQGVMQLVEEWIKPTLEYYMNDIFGDNVDLSNIPLIPSKQDILTYKTSKFARDNIVQAVYNNVYLSICYDIYNTKCLNPGHTEYYSNYGGFNEDLRRIATTALYFYEREDVISSLINGTIREYDKQGYVYKFNKHKNDIYKEYNINNSVMNSEPQKY